jgi:hypothetical protein
VAVPGLTRYVNSGIIMKSLPSITLNWDEAFLFFAVEVKEAADLVLV